MTTQHQLTWNYNIQVDLVLAQTHCNINIVLSDKIQIAECEVLLNSIETPYMQYTDKIQIIRSLLGTVKVKDEQRFTFIWLSYTFGRVVTYDNVALDFAAGSNPRVFTLDFDGKGSEQGIYYDVDPSGVLSTDSVSGVSLQLDGVQTNIEVPFFQNNEFSEFKFDGYFKRDSSAGEGEQGILFNGNSPASGDWPASIYVISTGTHSLRAGIKTDAAPFSFDIDSTASVGLSNVTISRFFIRVLHTRNCPPICSHFVVCAC
jgi:hypothetical protein